MHCSTLSQKNDNNTVVMRQERNWMKRQGSVGKNSNNNINSSHYNNTECGSGGVGVGVGVSGGDSDDDVVVVIRYIRFSP